MDYDTCTEIANKICDKLISLCRTKKTQGKSLIQLCDELLDKKYAQYRMNIFPYVPDQLAHKGYEIVNAEHFEIKKY